MAIFTLIAAIAFLLLLIAVLRLNAFIALILTAFGVGILRGLSFVKIIESINKGIGSTLGGLLVVLAFGIMLGSLLAETGAAQSISSRLIQVFGEKRSKWALLITGFVVGLAMFYNAGFVILIPLVFTVSATTGLPLVYLGIAIASGLSVTHGFLPPHPGPTAIVVLFKADMGRTLIYGTLIAIPTILLTGGLFPEFLKHIKANPPQGLIEVKNIEGHLLPPFSLSIGIALTPVLLMAMATIGDLNLHRDSGLLPYLKFVGDPAVSMIIAFLIALVFIGILRGGNDRSWKDKMDDLMGKMSNSLSAAVMIFLIIGSGGAFKQVLQDSGIGSDLALIFNGLQTNPLILGWLVATIIRISIGSATVAGLTAAGIVQPLLADPSVSPELMVLSVGAGSLMCSHVNDTGFWMFKEYFGLTLKDTFLTWTLMETIVGIGGLIGVLVLDIWL